MSLKKRIIPCLDIKNGRTVKGVNFVGLRDAGDPVQLAKQYADQGADELCFLDITATLEKRDTLVPLVLEVAQELNIPFTVGGGINSVALAQEIIKAGADKVAVNSAAVKHPELISELADALGSQCVVVAVDTRGDLVYVAGGSKPTELDTVTWCKRAQKLGAGEILLTSMDADGTKAGFDLDITGRVAAALQIPVIASGGGGTTEHFADLFLQTEASAGLAASIFHFGELPVPQLKRELKDLNLAIR